MPFKSVCADDLFHCRQCGDCCQGFGGTYVSSEDIAAIADYIKISEKELLEKYCRMSGNRRVLAQGADGYCVFFDKLCTIHPVKPKMCKAWPFIRSVLVDVQNWHIMAGLCPGMRTDFPDDVIQKITKKELDKK